MSVDCRNRNDHRPSVSRLPRNNNSFSNFDHLGRPVSPWCAPPGARIYYDTAITSTVIHGEMGLLHQDTLLNLLDQYGAIEGGVEHAIFLFLFFLLAGKHRVSACAAHSKLSSTCFSGFEVARRRLCGESQPTTSCPIWAIPYRLTLPFGFLFDSGEDR